MGNDFTFSLATLGKDVPYAANWIHEVKLDGYRLRVVRNGKSVRLLTRNGADWTHRYPWIRETALKLKSDQFIIDGEAIVLDVRGHSDFEALHSRRFDEEVQLYAFDIVAESGRDLARMPLSLRKTTLQRLLRGRMDGIHAVPLKWARSDRIFSGKLVGWVSRALSPSRWTGPTSRAGAITGSNQKNALTRPSRA